MPLFPSGAGFVSILTSSFTSPACCVALPAHLPARILRAPQPSHSRPPSAQQKRAPSPRHPSPDQSESSSGPIFFCSVPSHRPARGEGEAALPPDRKTNQARAPSVRCRWNPASSRPPPAHLPSPLRLTLITRTESRPTFFAPAISLPLASPRAVLTTRLLSRRHRVRSSVAAGVISSRLIFRSTSAAAVRSHQPTNPPTNLTAHLAKRSCASGHVVWRRTLDRP